MKFNMTAKVFGFAFTKLLKKYYKEHFPDVDINTIAKDVNAEYRAMVERTPGIGKGNMLASNLVGACYFFAMAKKIPNMTPELMDQIVDESMHSDLMVKMHKKKKEKGTLFSDKNMDKWTIAATKSRHSDYEMDWEFTFERGENEYYYNYTKCGVCRLAEREDLLPYLPCMCKMDYPKFEIQGAKLYRTKTLAAGDECCDFHIVRDKG